MRGRLEQIEIGPDRPFLSKSFIEYVTLGTYITSVTVMPIRSCTVAIIRGIANSYRHEKIILDSGIIRISVIHEIPAGYDAHQGKYPDS